MSIESRTPTEADLKVIENQLGRTPRDVHAISYRCPCGKPAVVETPPRLSNGEPFPTFFYATCPRLTAAISTLETTGMMESMTKRLETDAELAGAYAAAHEILVAAAVRSWDSWPSGMRRSCEHRGTDRCHASRGLLRIDRPIPLQIRSQIRPNPSDSKRSER